MNKNIIIITLIVALMVVASLYFWSSNNRYYMITNTNGLIVKLDKTTGDMWYMNHDGVLVKMPEYDVLRSNSRVDNSRNTSNQKKPELTQQEVNTIFDEIFGEKENENNTTQE